jgi:prolyl-tRNA synthetase
VTSAGEDLIYVDEKKHIAVNKDVLDDAVLKDLGLKRSDLAEKKAVEVGNIFNLGTKFSDALGLSYVDEKGGKKPVIMGSYGIGPGRVMGTIVEVLADAKGIVWPLSVAPFRVHLILVDGKDGKAKKDADKFYSTLLAKGIEVLYDDRDLRPGEKFADSDLIGIPLRVVVSDKSLEKGGYEIKERTSDTTSILAEKELLSRLDK